MFTRNYIRRVQTDFDIFLSEAIKEVFKECDGRKYFHALITSGAENSLPSDDVGIPFTHTDNVGSLPEQSL